MVYSPDHLFIFAPSVTSKTMLWLEFFHPYKHACEALWRSKHFFTSFFAPLHHHNHPKNKVVKSTKLKLIECYLVQLRLVYPSVRDELQEAIECASAENRVALENVKFLFEFLIPVVPFASLPHLS